MEFSQAQKEKEPPKKTNEHIRQIKKNKNKREQTYCQYG